MGPFRERSRFLPIRCVCELVAAVIQSTVLISSETSKYRLLIATCSSWAQSSKTCGPKRRLISADPSTVGDRKNKPDHWRHAADGRARCLCIGGVGCRSACHMTMAPPQGWLCVERCSAPRSVHRRHDLQRRRAANQPTTPLEWWASARSRPHRSDMYRAISWSHVERHPEVEHGNDCPRRLE